METEEERVVSRWLQTYRRLCIIRYSVSLIHGELVYPFEKVTLFRTDTGLKGSKINQRIVDYCVTLHNTKIVIIDPL